MTGNEQTSYIFAKCKGERAHTISQIERIPNVESATPVTGRFDLVIKLRTNERTKAFTAMEKIRNVPSITNNQTTISFESIINSSNPADSKSPLAFALLKVRGSFDTILGKLKTIPNFAEAHVIPGAFDIFAAFRADRSEDLLEKSVEKIGSIDGITASETLISYSLPGRSARVYTRTSELSRNLLFFFRPRPGNTLAECPARPLLVADVPAHENLAGCAGNGELTWSHCLWCGIELDRTSF